MTDYFVIFHKETTHKLKCTKASKSSYSTVGAARAALTRAKRAGQADDNYVVDTVANFSKLEKTHQVRNLMTGQLVSQSVNTPRCCDVSSELYWSM